MYLPKPWAMDRIWYKVNFKWSKADEDSEFFFLLDWLQNQSKRNQLPRYLPIGIGENNGFSQEH